MIAGATRLRAQSVFDSTALAQAVADAVAREDSPFVVIVPAKSPWAAKVAAALRSYHSGVLTPVSGRPKRISPPVT